MADAAAIFHEWLSKVEPRIQYIRSAYLAVGVLEELTSDAKAIVDDWAAKTGDSNPELARSAQLEYESADQLFRSYENTWQAVSIQMEQVGLELDKLQDERLTLSALCRGLHIAELGTEVLEKVYGSIGPNTAVDLALNSARQIVNDLDAEAKARRELRDFLSNNPS